LSTIDTEKFRKLLEEEKARLESSARRLEHSGSIEDELGELSEDADDNHLGDTATATYDRELDEGLEAGVRQTIEEIDAALQRIEDGTYGICEVDGKPIGEDRLTAIPWTRYCLDNQHHAG
jgi:DnaK suppressor protein